jgi:hypothetical protein
MQHGQQAPVDIWVSNERQQGMLQAIIKMYLADDPGLSTCAHPTACRAAVRCTSCSAVFRTPQYIIVALQSTIPRYRRCHSLLQLNTAHRLWCAVLCCVVLCRAVPCCALLTSRCDGLGAMDTVTWRRSGPTRTTPVWPAAAHSSSTGNGFTKMHNTVLP